MKRTLIVLIALAPLIAAEKAAQKPKNERHHRRGPRVIVVRPYYDPATEAASIAGSVIGNLIGNWIARKSEQSSFNAWAQPGAAEAEYIPTPRAPVEPQFATYTIQASEPGSEVLIDAKPAGLAPVTLILKSGVRFIVVRHKGFETWTSEVESRAGDELTVQADLKPIEVTPNVIVVKPSAPRN